jgi:hypothetical protein
MTFQQHKQVISNGEAQERTWQVDLDVAAQVMAWSRRAPVLLAQEIGEMAEHFPHWLLVCANGRGPHACEQCGEMIVFAAGAARCVACERPHPTQHGDLLAWVGHLPSLIRNSPPLLARLPALTTAGAPTIDVNGSQYVLVPFVVSYPEHWPNVEPVVRYGAGILEALGLHNGPGSLYHLYGHGQACLYAPNQWRGASVRVVLQQRVVNHLVSLLKIAAGVAPAEAFIGRIH